MSLADLELQTSAIGKINEAILDCVASQDIDRAIGLAIERQKALIEIVQLAKNNEQKLATLAEETLSSISEEHLVLKSHASKKRNDYLVRKSAIKAYLAPIAA